MNGVESHSYALHWNLYLDVIGSKSLRTTSLVLSLRIRGITAILEYVIQCKPNDYILSAMN